MWVPTQPETYQHVKTDLTAVTTVLLCIYSWAVARWILPPWQIEKVKDLLSVGSGNVFLEKGVLFVGAIAVAVLLVYFFEIHDAFYDRYLVRWRKYYDVDVILRALTMPFGSKLSRRFFVEAERDRKPFMWELFYHFVRDRDHKISKNAIVRFYERIWKYWATQINELLLIAMLLMSAIYGVFVEGHTVRFVVPVAISCLIGVNRLLVKLWLPPVREATLDEIAEIHRDHLHELEKNLKKVCEDFRLPYGP